MPAIQPARLKEQTLLLAEQFNQPRIFLRLLTDLLTEYTDHTYRHGHSGEPPALVNSFNTPKPVTRQVYAAISPLISTNTTTALEICDLLWQQPYLEHRQLAIEILSQLPIKLENELLTRIQDWVIDGIDAKLVAFLLDHGLHQIRAQNPVSLIYLSEQWLMDSSQFKQRLGFQLLILLSSDPSFDNLPVIFRLLAPFLYRVPSHLRQDIASLLRYLIQRSPIETANLLKQSIQAQNDPDTVWLLRRVITMFNPELQPELRAIIRDAVSSTK